MKNLYGGSIGGKITHIWHHLRDLSRGIRALRGFTFLQKLNLKRDNTHPLKLNLKKDTSQQVQLKGGKDGVLIQSSLPTERRRTRILNGGGIRLAISLLMGGYSVIMEKRVVVKIEKTGFYRSPVLAPQKDLSGHLRGRLGLLEIENFIFNFVRVVT